MILNQYKKIKSAYPSKSFMPLLTNSLPINFLEKNEKAFNQFYFIPFMHTAQNHFPI